MIFRQQQKFPIFKTFSILMTTYFWTLMQEFFTGVLKLYVKLSDFGPVFVRWIRFLVERVVVMDMVDDCAQIGESVIQAFVVRMEFYVQLGYLYPAVQYPIQIRPVVLQHNRFAFQINSGLGIDVRQWWQTGRVYQRIDVDPSSLK